MNDVRHGTAAGYRDDDCRCNLCKKAIAKNHNVYKLRRAANGGGPLMIPKDAAVRRLRALMALGWPRRELARQAGYRGDAFALVLAPSRQHLMEESNDRINELYERLCMTVGPSATTRRIALEKGWLPPLAYDDIDQGPDVPCETSKIRANDDLKDSNPDGVDHVVVARALAYDFNIVTTKYERHAVIRLWVQRGRSLAELERLSGWNVHRELRGAVA